MLWLSSYFLHRDKNNSLHWDENNSEIILFGPREDYLILHLGFLTPYNTPCARNLGILFDSSLKF